MTERRDEELNPGMGLDDLRPPEAGGLPVDVPDVPDLGGDLGDADTEVVPATATERVPGDEDVDPDAAVPEPPD